MQINLSSTASENCPSFEFCQVNACPLEKKPNFYKNLDEDKKLFNHKKCSCSKKKRIEIAKAFNQKTLGLTLRELSGMRKSLTLKEQIFFTKEKNLGTPKNSYFGGRQ